MNKNSINQNYTTTLVSSFVDTPLGQMLAIADEHVLYFLGFMNRTNLEQEIEKLCITIKAKIIPGASQPLESIAAELVAYFNSTLQEFKTPIHPIGTPFQKTCWNALQQIPYGHTTSYAQQAHTINNTNAHRAVGTANRNNKFSIIIPCHRIINSNGNMGGYNGGIDRKQWLIDFEKKHA